MQRTPPCPRCPLLPAPPKGEDASRRLLSSLASCRAPKASGPENVSPVAEGGRFYDGLSRDYSGRVCDHASERREPLQLFRCFRVSGSWSWRGGALERAALTAPHKESSTGGFSGSGRSRPMARASATRYPGISAGARDEREGLGTRAFARKGRRSRQSRRRRP